MNFYEILGVSSDASSEEIRRQYQELARKYHPDKATEEASEDQFSKITEAWKVLGDLRKRKEYDDQVKRDQVCRLMMISLMLFRWMTWYGENEQGHVIAKNEIKALDVLASNDSKQIVKFVVICPRVLFVVYSLETS